MTEANSSVTYQLTDPNGFDILLTFRDEEPAKLMTSLVDKGKWLLANGFKAQVKRGAGGFPPKPPAETVPDRKCPTCGSPLVYQTLKDGRKMIKCSTQKYNFTLKKAEGCPFVEWNDKPKNDIGEY